MACRDRFSRTNDSCAATSRAVCAQHSLGDRMGQWCEQLQRARRDRQEWGAAIHFLLSPRVVEAEIGAMLVIFSWPKFARAVSQVLGGRPRLALHGSTPPLLLCRLARWKREWGGLADPLRAGGAWKPWASSAAVEAAAPAPHAPVGAVGVLQV